MLLILYSLDNIHGAEDDSVEQAERGLSGYRGGRRKEVGGGIDGDGHRVSVIVVSAG